MNNRSFLQDVKDFLFPERAWHYVFHALVVLVAIAYWVVSIVRLPSGSMDDIIMYRPEGDTQLWPVVAAFSKFNFFGDATDVVHHGQGVQCFPIVCLLPHALACALFGKAGYIIADAFLSLVFFLAATLFFRQCNFGRFGSLLAGAALATDSLQALCGKVAEAFSGICATFGISLWESGTPNLFELTLFEKRIHRPMFSEIFVVFSLYFLLKLWTRQKTPVFRNGLAVGASMALLMQGDIYFFSILGLVLAWVVLRIMAVNRWVVPWGFFAGGLLGGGVFGSTFIYQRLMDNPDYLGRVGLTAYSRWHPLFLPGYSSLLRIAIICGFAWMVLAVCRRTNPALQTLKKKKSESDAVPEPASAVSQIRLMAIFFIALAVAAWFAEPAHIFLLGKAAQIYHFLFCVPVVFGYALIVLVFTLLRLLLPPEITAYVHQLGLKPGKWGALALAGVLIVGTILALESPLRRVVYSKTPRGADVYNEPWGQVGDYYRPSLRDLDREFQENPILQSAKSFTTFDLDVYVLLTAFHDKLAFNPDSYVLTDDEMENRFCEAGKILQMSPNFFRSFIQQSYVMNYWLGANKYRFATDHRFGTDDDYRPEAIASLKRGPQQWGWILLMPNSEVERIGRKFEATLGRKSDVASYPDLIILTAIDKGYGLTPSPDLYDPVPTSNQVFFIYKKKPNAAASAPSPTPEA